MVRGVNYRLAGFQSHVYRRLQFQVFFMQFDFALGDARDVQQIINQVNNLPGLAGDDGQSFLQHLRAPVAYHYPALQEYPHPD